MTDQNDWGHFDEPEDAPSTEACMVLASNEGELNSHVAAFGQEGYRIVSVLISPQNGMYVIVAQKGF